MCDNQKRRVIFILEKIQCKIKSTLSFSILIEQKYICEIKMTEI